jgi:site-specific recombinase
MPALPFNPVDLASTFGDVAWAIGIAFVLALVTSRPAKPPTVEDAMAAMEVTDVSIVEDDDDGS